MAYHCGGRVSASRVLSLFFAIFFAAWSTTAHASEISAQSSGKLTSSANYFHTRPAGAVLRTGSQCAQLVTPSNWEPRPENYLANHTVPTSSQLASFYAQPINFPDGPPAADFAAVDGNFSGTTDMIIRWAACKWGMDQNILRAQAYQESTWSAWTTGDLRTDSGSCAAAAWDGWQTSGYCWQSFGISQIKVFSYNTWPMAWTSTSFNLDFRAAYWRACMNGDIGYYYGQVPVAGYPSYPNGTTSQKAWGCVGSWYSGSWYDSDALLYIADVQNWYNTQPWRNLPIGHSSSLAITSPVQNQTVSGTVNIGITLDQSDTKACYACWSLDGVSKSCVPAVGPWSWDTTYHVLNGNHAIQVDAYKCDGSGPNYHAAVDVVVSN